MEKIKYYILKLLERAQGCHFYRTDVEIKDIIRTHGNIGIYVKYDIVDHNTGKVWIPTTLVFIYNEQILGECDYQNGFGGTILHAERRTKLNMIELKKELTVL